MTFISPRDGYLAARKGYEDECRENEQVPNWAYFDKTMIGLLGGTPPAPPAPPEEPVEYLEVPWPTDDDALDVPPDVIVAPETPPSERPPDPSGLMSEALGTTQRRMEEG